MVARRLITILPAMRLAEALETTRIPRVALQGVLNFYDFWSFANRLLTASRSGSIQ
jgi:hypothetical protein